MGNIALITLQEVSEEQLEDIFRLFVQADFADISDTSGWLAEAIKGSLLAVAAQDESNGRLIGFARALGDGVSDCYIQDVVVAAEYRKQGIGKRLVQHLLQALAALQIDWVGLIATPGKAEFYRQMGFEVLEGFTPMLLKTAPEK